MATLHVIHCPKCRLQRQVRPEELGHGVACRRCGHKFEARLTEFPTAPPPPPPPPDPEPEPAVVAPAAAPPGEGPRGEGPPSRVAVAARPQKHARVLKELRETQDWISRLHDQVHELHVQMEQARGKPGAAPAAAPPGQDDLRAERDALRTRVAELQRKAEESDRLEVQLRTDLTRIQGLLSQLQQAPPPPAAAPGPALEDEENNRLRHAVQKLRAERDALRDRVAALEAPAAAGPEPDGLRAERDQLLARVAELEQQVTAGPAPEDSRAESDEIRAERDELRARVAELEQPAAGEEPDDLRAERDALRDRVAELEREADEARRLEGQLRADLGRVNNLWAQLEEGQGTPGPDPAQRLEDLAAELAAVRAERDRLAAQVEEGPPSAAEPALRQELEAAVADRDELLDRVAELERRAEDADRLEAQLRADLDRVNGLWAQLEEGQAPVAAAQPAWPAAAEGAPDRDADAERIAQMTAELRTVGAERDHLAAELQDLRQQQDAERNRRARAVAERNERLAEELAAAGAERDRLAAELEVLREELDLARAEEPDAVRALREQSEAVVAERDDLRARVEELERRTATADRLEVQLRADLARVNGVWAQLEGGSEVGASADAAALEAVTRERDRLRGELEDLRTTVERMQERTKVEMEKANRLWSNLEEAQGFGPAAEPESLDALAQQCDALRAERDRLTDEVQRLWGQTQVPETQEVDMLRPKAN